MARTQFGFEIIPRSRRAKPFIRTIRNKSIRFKYCNSKNDFSGMGKSSEEAWNAITNLFEILRNEEDQKRLDSSLMSVDTAYIMEDLNVHEIDLAIYNRRLDRTDARCRPASLRVALNKIAHHNTAKSTYRLDKRGAHYLVLGGEYRGKLWVIEILVSRLCNNASKAVQEMRYP